MVKFLLRLVVYLSIFVIIVGGVGAFGASRSRADWLSARDTPAPISESLSIPEYDPNKPTVAVILGNPLTEIFDVMVPYEMFAMTGLYNVFAIAPENKVISLTGGLDLAPHYSFQELDDFLGKSPDLIVVPYIPMSDEKNYQPVREWIQSHAETQILSICSGSRNLADAGLLKGKTAASHWRMFNHSQGKYPDTDWIRDLRYVQDGNIIASAGLTSGIDAVLYVIKSQFGKSAAEKVAQEMNYPTYHFVDDPKVEPYYVDRTELIYYMNLAFQFNKRNVGVLLYEGMEEGALASIFDTFSPLGTTRIFTISNSAGFIATKHNLNLVARYRVSDPPEIDQLLATGEQVSSKDVEWWIQGNHAVEPEFIQRHAPESFMFDAAIEELAKQEGLLTAKWVAKRLEYRATHLKLEGKLFSMEVILTPLLLSLLALLLAFIIDKRFISKRSFNIRSHRRQNEKF